jgi:hypothetical protein
LDLQSDITQAFIEKKYLVKNEPADILLDPDVLFKFLNKQKLLSAFTHTADLKVAYFRDADQAHSESESCIIEYTQGTHIKRASIQVMIDAFFREEHLCPVRINRNGDQYELLLAPLSEANLLTLDQFYKTFRINIARAYRVRRDVLNKPFKSSQLPNCLAMMFIDQNATYEESENSVDGISVSDESFNPDATLMMTTPEELARLFKKQ